MGAVYIASHYASCNKPFQNGHEEMLIAKWTEKSPNIGFGTGYHNILKIRIRCNVNSLLEVKMKDVNHNNLIEAKDVAEILNVKLTTVYTWALEGYLPAFKLGKLVRFRHDEVLAWIEGNKIEIEDEEEEGDCSLSANN